MVAVLLIVAAVRLIDVYLPDSVFGEDHMWAAYLILGLVFMVGAAVLWPRRLPREDDVGLTALRPARPPEIRTHPE